MNRQLSINSVPLGVLIYCYNDNDFICVDVNNTAKSAIELKTKEIIGLSIFDMFCIDRDSELFISLVKVHEQKKQLTTDIKLSSALVNKSCICKNIEYLDNDNIVLFIHDVSENEIVKSDLAIIEKTAHIGNWYWDMKKNSVTWSDEVYRIFGEKPQSFTPTFEKFLSYLPKKDQDSLQQLIDHSIKTKESYIIEHELITSSGNSRYVQGAGHAKFDVNGVPFAFSGTVFDISDKKQSYLQLQESEEKFRKITEVSLMGIFLYKEHYIYANNAFCEISGYSLQELKNMHPWEGIDEKLQDMIKEVVKKRLLGEVFENKYTELSFTHKHGSQKFMRILTQTIFYQGSYAGLGTVMDITNIKEDKEHLRLLAQAVEQTEEMIRITDKDGINTYVNAALALHTGYREEDLIGQNNRIFKSGVHKEEFYKKMWKTILSGKSYKGIFVNKKKDGHLYHEEMTITPIFDTENKIQNFVATSQDITSRIQMQDELKRLATTDKLTGLFNRHQTDKELDNKISDFKRHKDPFSLVMIDIDHFKNVNDTFGHDVGDYVLKELSELILHQIRDRDHFSRWGGEEFMLLLPRLSLKEAVGVAEKIRIIISASNFKSVSELTISLGVAEFNKNDTKTTIIKRVDEALYRAKDSGRNCVVS